MFGRGVKVLFSHLECLSSLFSSTSNFDPSSFDGGGLTDRQTERQAGEQTDILQNIHEKERY